MTEIDSVYKYWNDRPCNIYHSNKEFGTKEYFEEVTKRKYYVESHIPNFAEFEKYKNKNVLEIGCGIGTAAQSFIENGANYYGRDLTEKSVEITKLRMNIFDLSATIFQANIENIEDFLQIQNSI
jgi:2-polyprenyl-3-methyl-5-hydroxy-6-metoxy-1,4-benzoquinol methylase